MERGGGDLKKKNWGTTSYPQTGARDKCFRIDLCMHIYFIVYNSSDRIFFPLFTVCSAGLLGKLKESTSYK